MSARHETAHDVARLQGVFFAHPLVFLGIRRREIDFGGLRQRRGRRGRGRWRRRLGIRRTAGDDVAHGAPGAQFFGQRIRRRRGKAHRAALLVAMRHQHLHHFLPREPHIRIVGRQDLGAENSWHAPVDLRDGNRRLAARNAIRQVTDLEGK
ncbi:MAG: hypothetical protein WDN28_24165 [Chthoniobacter sp.]